MPLSWNEIRSRALAFSRDWAGARSESADKQTFWNECFEIFGTKRRTVATFDEPVRQLSGTFGRIDLIGPGTLRVDHKSRGEHFDGAHLSKVSPSTKYGVIHFWWTTPR